MHPFELTIHGTQLTLAITRLRGVEALSNLYSFHLRAVLPLDTIGSLRKSLLGESATLSVSLPDDDAECFTGWLLPCALAMRASMETERSISRYALAWTACVGEGLIEYFKI